MKRRNQVRRLLDLVADKGRVRMITLTLRHQQMPLAQQLDRLYASFRTLRQRQAWKTHVKAGAAACEIHVGEDGKWHVHLHVLTVGDYWPQAEISNEWLAVTGDSRIVDIRMMPSERAVGYAAKYLGKAIPSDTPAGHVVEAIKALTGRRMLIVCGEWIGALSEDETPGKTGQESSEDAREVSPWRGIGYLSQLEQRAEAGDAYSIGVLNALARQRKTHPPPGQHTPLERPRVV